MLVLFSVPFILKSWSFTYATRVTWRGVLSASFYPGRRYRGVCGEKESHEWCRTGNEGGKRRERGREEGKIRLRLSSCETKAEKSSSWRSKWERDNESWEAEGSTVITSCMFKQRGNMSLNAQRMWVPQLTWGVMHLMSRGAVVQQSHNRSYFKWKKNVAD